MVELSAIAQRGAAYPPLKPAIDLALDSAGGAGEIYIGDLGHRGAAAAMSAERRAAPYSHSGLRMPADAKGNAVTDKLPPPMHSAAAGERPHPDHPASRLLWSMVLRALPRGERGDAVLPTDRPVRRGEAVLTTGRAAPSRGGAPYLASPVSLRAVAR